MPIDPLAETVDELALLPGIDTLAGLCYVNNSAALCLRLLGKFRDGHGVEFGNAFRAARLAEDWPTAIRQAHTLKGLALTIGAAVLAALAGRLEAAAQAQEPGAVSAIERELEVELARVMTGLMQIARPEDA